MTQSTIFRAGGMALLLVVCGCAAEPMAGPTQEQKVMQAQRAAKPLAKPGTAMNGDEAEVIYKNYLDAIGKPIEPDESGSVMATQ